jgi:hypothetical protein
MNEEYKKQVALLIRIMPSVYRIEEFAVHGGSAINLFHKNMPRYSVDIDLTYLPLKDREQSLKEINTRLLELKQYIEKTVPGIKVIPKLAVWKLLCVKDRAMVKIEVNGTKRGVIDDTEDKEFIISFEQGEPAWNKCCNGDLSIYPSVQWKLQNILKLKEINPEKYKLGIEKLSSFLLGGTQK